MTEIFIFAMAPWIFAPVLLLFYGLHIFQRLTHSKTIVKALLSTRFGARVGDKIYYTGFMVQKIS